MREKFRVTGAPVYGPFALGTSAYAPHLTDWPGGGVVGLHGTNEPGLIPGRPSHGCIRLRNEKITRLYRLAPAGHADPHPRLRSVCRIALAAVRSANSIIEGKEPRGGSRRSRCRHAGGTGRSNCARPVVGLGR